MGLQTLSPPPGPERALRANKWASTSASPSGERARAGPPGQTGISVLVQGLLPGADPVSPPPRHPLCAVCTDPEHGTSEPSERLPPGCAEAAWPPGDRSSAPSFLQVAQTQALAPLTLLGSQSETRSATPCSVASARPDARARGLACPSFLHPDPKEDQTDLCQQILWGTHVPPQQTGAWQNSAPCPPRAEPGYASNARGCSRCPLEATCHALASTGGRHPMFREP